MLAEEQLESLRKTLSTRVTLARDFFEKYGAHTPEAQEFAEKTGASLAVAETVEVVPIEPTIEPEPHAVPVAVAETGESVKQNVTIRVRGNAIQLGKAGKIIPLSGRSQERQHDYGPARVAALKLLIQNQDRVVSAQEIWKEIDSLAPRTTNARAAIRNWLSGLSYRRQPIIITSGKRGYGAKYWVSPAFSVDIKEEQLTKSEAQHAEKLPLELGDLYIAANQLEQFNPILKKHNCAEIDPKLVKSLRKYSPDNSHIRGDAQAIWDNREKAFSSVERFFDDEERFFDFLASADSKSPEYRFVEYLFGLDEEQRALVKRLMRARVEREVLSENQIRFWAINSRDKDDIIAFTDVITREPSQLTEMVEEHTHLQEYTAQVTPAAATPAQPPVTYDYGEIEAPKRARLSRRNRQRLDSIRLAAEEIADRFLADFNPDESYKRDQLASQFRTLTTKTVATAMENNVGPSAPRARTA